MADSVFAGSVQQLKREIATLRSQLEVAERALALLESPINPLLSVNPKMFGAIAEALGDLRSVTDAVIEAVRNSEGMERSQVVNAAIPLMATKSADPRKNAGTRLGQLIAEGRLVERDGKVYLGTPS